MKNETQLTEITPALLDTLRAAINDTLKPVGEAHGVLLELGYMTYSATQATTRFTITALGTDPEADNFREFAHHYGLDSSDLGKEVEIESVTGTIVGLNSRASRFPIIVRQADGTRMAVTEAATCRALGKELRSLAAIADQVRASAKN